MNVLSRTLAIFIVTFKRLRANLGLTLATLLGLTIAVGLITTVPLYADAVSYRILTERLSTQSENLKRPPFSFIYHYVGSWKGPVEWSDVQPLNDFLMRDGAAELGLPLEIAVRHIETNNFRLYPENALDYTDDAAWLGFFYLAATNGFADHVVISEGRFPAPASDTPDGVVEVLAAARTAEELGFQVGDRFVLYDYRQEDSAKRDLTVEISGIWRPIDPEDGFWFFGQSSYDDLFIVPDETMSGRVASQFDSEVYYALWYLVLDGSGVQTGDVPGLTARFQAVERNVDTLLPFTTAAVSPLGPLQGYRVTVDRLTRLLAAYDVPIVILVFSFIALIVGLSVDQRRNEIAMMRSRGATPGQVVGMSLLEGVLLGLGAWLLGTGVGLVFTHWMGRAQSFLDFSSETFLRVIVTPDSLRAGAFAVALALVAQLLPTIAASASTIVSYKQEQARSVTRPWWQRTGLDLLLLVPVVYGFYLLEAQGALLVVGENTSGEDPFQNPLLLLLPALTIFSGSLLVLRVLPMLMEAVRWLLFRTDSVGVLMAVQQLARAPRLYTTPLILLSLTVGLAVFTASLAQTMDFQVYDAQLYRVGADLSLTGPGLPIFGGGSRFNPNPEAERQAEAAIFLPMAEYESFPGVSAAARVGKYNGTAYTGGEQVLSKIYGVDRADFGRVAFWRWDFARFRLGALLNALATSPDALLASADFLRENGLRVGDFLRIDVSLGEGEVPLNAQIVGSVDYFPGWYRDEDGPLFITNLEQLFTLAGSEFPYEVWLQTTPAFDGEAFDAWLRSQRLFTWRWDEPYNSITQEQLRPERQGLFGLLSVGFIASAVVTLLGYFIYALFSFRKRMIEMGILRAVGMSQRQMGLWVGIELGLLIVLGLLLGAGSGSWVSLTFIPYLQLGAKSVELVPPYLVEVAWAAIGQILLLFIVLFVASMSVLTALLRRMRIFEAIKLGETT